MMNGAFILMNLILLFAVLYLVRKRYGGTSAKRDQNLARLEEVIRSAELTNGGFFRSLELVQKNLESLVVRAENAERRLRTLMLQPNADKKDQYAAAALLLGEGQQPERVAAMLNLPLPQVQTVRELRALGGADKKGAARKKRDGEAAAQAALLQKKSAVVREKVAARTAAPAAPAKKAEGAPRPSVHHTSRLTRVIA
jgi:hypothetical protein